MELTERIRDIVRRDMERHRDAYRMLSWGPRDCCGGSRRLDTNGHQPWCRYKGGR